MKWEKETIKNVHFSRLSPCWQEFIWSYLRFCICVDLERYFPIFTELPWAPLAALATFSKSVEAHRVQWGDVAREADSWLWRAGCQGGQEDRTTWQEDRITCQEESTTCQEDILPWWLVAERSSLAGGVCSRHNQMDTKYGFVVIKSTS